MINKQQTKVRVVKCPRCAELLPEPEHVPVYICGGCNTTLQAKNYRGFQKDTALSSNEQNVTKSNGIIHARDGEESGRSSRRSSSSGEYLSAQDDGRHQISAKNSSISEQNGAANAADHTSMSKETNIFKNKEQGEIDRTLDQFVSRNQNEGSSQDAVKSCNRSEQNGAATSAHHTALSGTSCIMENKENGERDKEIDRSDVKDQAANDYPPVVTNKESEHTTMANSAKEDDNGHVERCNGILVENRHQKQVEDLNYDRERCTVKDSQVLENDESQQHAMLREPIDIKEHQREKLQVGSVNSVRDASSPIEPPAIENPAEHKASDHKVSGVNRKVHPVEKYLHQDKSGNEIDRLDADESEKAEKAGKKYGNGTDTNNSVECIGEQLGSVKLSSAAPLSNEMTQGGNGDSEDDLEACRRNSASAPSSATVLKTSPNSLGNVKGTSKQNIKNLKDSAVYINSEGSLLEVPRSTTKRSPAYDGSVSSFDGNDDQVPERPAEIGDETMSTNNAVARYDDPDEIPERNNITSERIVYRNPRVQTQAKSSLSLPLDQKLKSRMVQEGSLEENEISRRNNRHRPIRDNIPPRVPYRRRSSELAFETGSSSSYALHDEPPSRQMHHRHPYRRRFAEVPWREKEFLPVYYNYETSGEIYDRPKYHAYVDRRRRAESWSQSGTLPQMPYSGEIFNGRHPYMHRHHGDRRWSAQLPRPALCCHQGVHMGPSWESSWDPYDSYPTSPQRHVESESSCTWGHETIYRSDDQRHKDQIMRRLYLREKRQTVKRHFHPIAGGAPFIICYFCFYVLQLPEGFLHSRRKRTQKLKCGACSSILEFSLENEGCLAPCEANVDQNPNLAAPSHGNHSRRSSLNSADPGNSMNGERIEGLQDDAHHSVRGRQAKVTWQLSGRSKSPLHRLMGYSSPQDLLGGREADDVE